MSTGLIFQQIMAPLALVAGVQTTPASLPLGDGPDRHDVAVHRTVEAILDFTRWPRRTSPVRLCVVGPARHAGRLDAVLLSDGRTVSHVRLEPSADLTGQCDALYIAPMPLPALRRVTTRVRGAGLVTIAEDDPGCRGEAMFCLLTGPTSMSFELNIDAVSRSGVSLDPRVLRMSKGY